MPPAVRRALTATGAGDTARARSCDGDTPSPFAPMSAEKPSSPMSNPRSPLFSGSVSFLTTGVVESLWDEVALAEYPSRTLFVQMTATPEYRDIAVHREAGLEGQLNIETVRGAIPASRG